MTINPKAGIDPADISGALRDFTGSTTGITARAGGGQANATALTTAFNNVTTVGTAGDSVRLPTARAGATIIVTNATATSMNIFPATGGIINALSPNAQLACAAGVTIMFVCTLAGTWRSITGP
jgi:hypothetical protein